MLHKNDLDKGIAKGLNKQNVSVLVDNELEAFANESSFALESEEMRLWGRYHLIGQIMRDEVQHIDLDISASVNERLANEVAHNSRPARSESKILQFPTKIFKPLAGYAIAASVALVVLFNVGQQQVASQATPVTLAAGTDSASSMANLTRVERQELQTIHDMFLKHEALSASSLLPSVQVVSNQKVIPVSVPLIVEKPSELEVEPASLKDKSQEENNR